MYIDNSSNIRIKYLQVKFLEIKSFINSKCKDQFHCKVHTAFEKKEISDFDDLDIWLESIHKGSYKIVQLDIRQWKIENKKIGNFQIKILLNHASINFILDSPFNETTINGHVSEIRNILMFLYEYMVNVKECLEIE